MTEPLSNSPSRFFAIRETLFCVLLLATLHVTIYVAEGSLSMQRSLVNLVMPIGLSWAIAFWLGCRWWIRRQYRLAMSAMMAFALLSVLFNPYLAGRATAWLEGAAPKPSPLEVDRDHYRTVVVLGGCAAYTRSGYPEVSGEGQRLIAAAQLWHAGKTKTIVCTGEDNFIPDAAKLSDDERDRFHPWRVGVDLLHSLNVPKEALFHIGGINTSGEMQNLKRFLDSPPAGFPTEGSVGLITSAFHMDRSMRLAATQNLQLEPIPVAYKTAPDQSFSLVDVVPSVVAGGELYRVARELLARPFNR